MPDDGSAAESLALVAGATQHETHAVSYGTEAGIFQQAEIATIVCGPGDIAQAHQPNEFIELAQIDACETFLRKLIDHLSA